MDSEQQLFTAVILAADREKTNPGAEAAGVRCKSLTPVNNIPMILRVLDALSLSGKVKNKLLCGPPRDILEQATDLNDYVTSGKALWVENQSTPSLSAYDAMKSLPQTSPILLTTSDHALLTPKIVDYFCQEAQGSGCDVVVGLARHATVVAAYPETSRTAYRFKDGSYCSCNLFAFLTPRSLEVPSFWRRIETQRKNPLRVISTLGWITVIRYLIGNLSLPEAMDRISRLFDCKAGFVVIPYPEAAIDVDSAEDWRLVQQIAADHSE